jgi:hypothetical protein
MERKMIKAIPRKGRAVANVSQSRLITLLDEAYKAGHTDCGYGKSDVDVHLEEIIAKVFGEAIDLDESDNAHDQLLEDQGEKSWDEVG